MNKRQKKKKFGVSESIQEEVLNIYADDFSKSVYDKVSKLWNCLTSMIKGLTD